jgi:hypothetical protein
MAEECFKKLKRESADGLCEKNRCSACPETEKSENSDTDGCANANNRKNDKSTEKKGFLAGIRIPELDKDTAIILFFLIFLYKNGSDPKLLIALAYILL